jgi:hypothetical protein
MSNEAKGKRLYIRPPKDIFETEEAIQAWATQVWVAFTGLEAQSKADTESTTELDNPS